MKNFLELLAQEIYQNPDFVNTTIVLPNKRAGIFLGKALVNQAKKTIISPDIIDINEFINRLSPWQNIEGLELIFEFYETYQSFYKNQEKIEIKSFDEFIKWAPIVLRDFEEIDKFLLAPKIVFNYLSEAKALEQWNLENAQSDFIKEYKAYFSSLGNLHEAFVKKLSQKNLAYTGMIYRYIAENIDQLSDKITQPIIFAGFNALTKAEEKIFLYLIENQQAKIFWDADEYYLKQGFEAGNSLRENQKKFKDFHWIGKYFQEPKNIEIIETSGKTAQMQITAQIISDKIRQNPQADFTKTAIVLNENDLLFPLLNTLPPNPDAVNVSLGIPINKLPVIQIFISTAQLFADYEQYEKIKATSLLELLRSPQLLRLLNEQEKNSIKKLSKRIFNYGSKLIPANFIQGISLELPDILQKILQSPKEVNAVLNIFLQINDFLSEKNLSMPEKISLMKMGKIIRDIIEFQDRTQIISSFKSLILIFRNLLNSEQLFFEGEPLQGLQILGLLETRLLDFEHVIVTSVNEGILPQGKTHRSLIPFDIKLELGLPTHRNQNSIMAYHFYRLLQRAKNIHLIFNANSAGLNTGEASRFILQIQEELKAYQPKTQIHHKKYDASAQLLSEQTSIPKTDALLKKLEEKAISGISPSFLDAYIYDPYEFVKNRLLGLQQEEELIEGIPVNIYGNIVHDTLRDLYKKLEGKTLQKHHIQNFKKHYKELIINNFEKHTGEKKPTGGKKYIAMEIIQKNILDIIKTDEKILSNPNNELEILEIENLLISPLNFSGKTINIKGYVDRIDRLNGQIRIIDYKTGSVSDKHLKYDAYRDNLDILIEESDKRKIFQVLTYIWLYKQSGKMKNGENAIGGIISTRKFKKGLFPISLGKEIIINDEILLDYQSALQKLLQELFNPEIPFEKKNL